MKDITKPTTLDQKAQQRRRGALSCAECRRLKLRCDRVFPCQSCKKRGCAAICPDGALTTGKGNRFILANTEELHERIEALQERITSLELGLTALHAQTPAGQSGEAHPLLTDDLLNIKTPIGAEIVGTANPRTVQRERERAMMGTGMEEDVDEHEHDGHAHGEGSGSGEGGAKKEEEMADSFGTLQLGEGSAQSRFFGIAAGAHYLLGESDHSDDAAEEDTLRHSSTSKSPPHRTDGGQPTDPSHSVSVSQTNSPRSSNKSSPSSNPLLASLTGPLANLARSYPFNTLGKDWPAARDQLHPFLPDPHHAWLLSEQYFEHGAWLYNPISRLYYVERIFTPIMDPSYVPDASDPKKPVPTAADYGVLFIVLALGSVLNLSTEVGAPAYAPEAERYHALSRAALGAEEPLMDSVTAVQALMLICFYNQLANDKDAPARAWSLSGLAYKMAFAIGLHRDGKRWKLDQEETDRRRTVYWELAMFDAWSSQGLGRPPTMFNVHVDVEFPTEQPAYFDSNGNPEMSFHRNKYIYASTLIEIYDKAFAAKRPPYDVILRLDRNIRDLDVPLSLQVQGINSNPSGPQPPQPTTRAQVMQAHTTLCIKEACLLNIHRGYLAKALLEHPDDPFKSRYAASVLAAHRSSCAMLAGVRSALYLLPRLTPRIFFLWIHAFSAAMVLATIVIRSPSSNLTSSCLRELDAACEMFERAKEGWRPSQLLPTLLKLRTRAQTAFEDFRQGKPRFLSPPIDSVETTHTEDDVTMLGGKSRLVRTKEKNHGTPTGASPPSLHSHEGDGSSSMEDSPRPQAADYHPTLAEYLKAYNQQLHQHEVTSAATGLPSSPDAVRPELVAAAVAQITGEMTPINSNSSSSATGASSSMPPTSSSATSASFDYNYGFAVPENKPGMVVMDRVDSNNSFRMSPQQYMGQQQQQQQMYYPQGGRSPQYAQYQSPSGGSPLAQHSTSMGESHSSNSAPSSHLQQRSPHMLHPMSGPHSAPPEQTSSEMPSSQYYSDNLQNPNTPFSAFEPAFMGARRAASTQSSGAAGSGGLSLPPMHSEGPFGGMHQQPSHQQMQQHHQQGQQQGQGQSQPRSTQMGGFGPFDMSPMGQPAPDAIDIGWQFMSDLRPYL